MSRAQPQPRRHGKHKARERHGAWGTVGSTKVLSRQTSEQRAEWPRQQAMRVPGARAPHVEGLLRWDVKGSKDWAVWLQGGGRGQRGPPAW